MNQSQQKLPTNNQTIMMLATVSLCLLLIACRLPASSAYGPMADLQQQQLFDGSRSGSVSLAVIENPEITAHVLESLLRSIIVSANVNFQSTSVNQSAQKRGLDLGISRGFSGSQAGKHLMGLSAASFANGPGRK